MMNLYPSVIYIYDAARFYYFDFDAVKKYIADLSGGAIEVASRDDIISCYLSRLSSGEQEQVIDNIARKMAQSKVRDLAKPFAIADPLPGEILYEKKRIRQTGARSFGLLYDGFRIMQVFSELIPEAEQDPRLCHVVLTDRLMGTMDENDLRYHARVSVCGYPSVISIPGIVEAPAKPRDFYLKQQFGGDRYELKQEFREQYIDYEDPCITEVVKGYVLQAAFYTLTGNPFCEQKDCRLFNAHRQEELIHAQVASGVLCERHKRILETAGN